MPDGVEEHGGSVRRHGLRGEQRAADRLADHREHRVPLGDDEVAPSQLDHPGNGAQFHAEALLGAPRELLAAGVVAGIDDALAVRSGALDLAHRAPEHPLAAPAVRGERVEEAHAVGHFRARPEPLVDDDDDEQDARQREVPPHEPRGAQHLELLVGPPVGHRDRSRVHPRGALDNARTEIATEERRSEAGR